LLITSSFDYRTFGLPNFIRQVGIAKKGCLNHGLNGLWDFTEIAA
jgi:hypothetical protein